MSTRSLLGEGQTKWRSGGMKETIVVALLSAMPYFCCKLAIAANTAFIEYFYGQSDASTLGSESDTLHWEFLWMGTAMGGMRAMSIVIGGLVGSIVSNVETSGRLQISDEPNTASERSWSPMRCVRLLFRGALVDEGVVLDPSDASQQQISDVVNLAWVLTTLYGIVVSIFYYYSASLFFIAPNTSDELRSKIQEYGRGFAWGVLPIQWLYFNGQLCLGVQATGIPFLYDGLVNNVVATIVAWKLYPTHGAYGMGCGMSVGAWTAWLLNTVHFAVDPHWRNLGVAVPFASRINRIAAVFEDLLTNRNSAARKYLWFAVPLSIANMLGLSQGLIVAAIISEHTNDDAMAYSISGAYFQTLSIAMLSISSVVSAILASCAPITDQCPRKRRQYTATLCALLFALAAILSALPLLAPDAFARTFGGQVYAFGNVLTKELMPKVIRYNQFWVAAFLLSTMGNLLGAIMHAWGSLWLPTLVSGVGNALGIIWCYSYMHKGTDYVAGGGVMVAGVQLLGLCALLWRHRREYFGEGAQS